MRILLLSIFSLIFSSFYAQSKIIGKVIDEEFNETMPFANVLVKGTNIGVTTDFDGNYSINIQSWNLHSSFFICWLQNKRTNRY